MSAVDRDELAGDVLAVHAPGHIERLDGRAFWSLVDRCGARLEAELPDARFLALIGRTTPLLMATFVGAMARGRLVTLFPPASPRQDATYQARQQAVAFGRIAPDAVLVEDEAALAALGAGRVMPLAFSTPTPVVSPERARDAFFAALAGVDDGPLFVQHSSGTTGIKKAVTVTAGMLRAQHAAYWPVVTALAGARPRVASWLPLYHDMGLVAAFLLPLIAGAPLSLIDPFDWADDPASLLRMIAGDGCEITWMPNFAFRHLVRLRRHAGMPDLSSMRAWIDCSETCRRAEARDFEAAYADCGVRQGSVLGCYAMAETVFAVSQARPGKRLALRAPAGLRSGDEVFAAGGVLLRDGQPADEAGAILSSGPVLDGVEVVLLADGALVVDGICGEIAVRGPMLFESYRHLDRAASAIRADGFFLTGDIGVRLAGELFVIGRTKAVLIVNGRNLHAADVEDVLNRVAGVRPGRVAAFGVPDPRLGSEALVIVAERDAAAGVEAATLRAALGAAVAEALPATAADVRVVEERWLVKNSAGKIARDANREKYLAMWGGTRESPLPPSRKRE